MLITSMNYLKPEGIANDEKGKKSIGGTETVQEKVTNGQRKRGMQTYDNHMDSNPNQCRIRINVESELKIETEECLDVFFI